MTALSEAKKLDSATKISLPCRPFALQWRAA